MKNKHRVFSFLYAGSSGFCSGFFFVCLIVNSLLLRLASHFVVFPVLCRFCIELLEIATCFCSVKQEQQRPQLMLYSLHQVCSSRAGACCRTSIRCMCQQMGTHAEKKNNSVYRTSSL